jgi:hypothetical protein
MLKFGSGFLSSTWCALLKIWVSKNPFKKYPTPCKNKECQHRNTKHNPFQWIVPLNNKKFGGKSGGNGL